MFESRPGCSAKLHRAIEAAGSENQAISSIWKSQARPLTPDFERIPRIIPLISESRAETSSRRLPSSAIQSASLCEASGPRACSVQKKRAIPRGLGEWEISRVHPAMASE